VQNTKKTYRKYIINTDFNTLMPVIMMILYLLSIINWTCKGSFTLSVIQKPTSRPHTSIYVYPSDIYIYIYRTALEAFPCPAGRNIKGQKLGHVLLRFATGMLLCPGTFHFFVANSNMTDFGHLFTSASWEFRKYTAASVEDTCYPSVEPGCWITRRSIREVFWEYNRLIREK
jgi:hypothetical protein